MASIQEIDLKDPEKGSSASEIDTPDLDQVGEREGYVLDASLGHASTRHLKTTKDGSIILIPQPSADPNDPLNWSKTKKMVILIVVSCTGKDDRITLDEAARFLMFSK